MTVANNKFRKSNSALTFAFSYNKNRGQELRLRIKYSLSKATLAVFIIFSIKTLQNKNHDGIHTELYKFIMLTTCEGGGFS